MLTLLLLFTHFYFLYSEATSIFNPSSTCWTKFFKCCIFFLQKINEQDAPKTFESKTTTSCFHAQGILRSLAQGILQSLTQGILQSLTQGILQSLTQGGPTVTDTGDPTVTDTRDPTVTGTRGPTVTDTRGSYSH